MELEIAPHSVLKHPRPLSRHRADVEVHHARVERGREGLGADGKVPQSTEFCGTIEVGSK